MSGNTRAPELWDAQFDPSLDFAPATPTIKYVICTSPRSGSHFLGHRLYGAGGFGYPLEYLQRQNFERWRQRAREAGATDVFAYVKRVRTDSNGVFGVKVHYKQLPAFLAHEPQLQEYRFITLERRDLLKQAVSYSWAAQTNQWISAMPARGAATYDWDDIARRLVEITESNAGWASFLAGLGISPCRLIFEDVRADPAAAVATVAEFIGITPGGVATESRFSPEEQAERGKKEWLERFVAETRARLAQGGWPVRPAARRQRGWLRVLEPLLGTGRNG